MSKRANYRLSEEAQGDVERVIDYVIERWGPEAASKAANRLYDTFELLALQPEMGRRREQWTEADVLFWPIPSSPNLVIYRAGSPLEILRVWDARQDSQRLTEYL